MESHSPIGPVLMLASLFELFFILPIIFFKGKGRFKNYVMFLLLLGATALFIGGFALWRGLV
jgi:hypothetical protein